MLAVVCETTLSRVGDTLINLWYVYMGLSHQIANMICGLYSVLSCLSRVRGSGKVSTRTSI